MGAPGKAATEVVRHVPKIEVQEIVRHVPKIEATDGPMAASGPWESP